MKRDVLVEATRALREAAEQEAPSASPPRADETRARVMASLRAGQARRLSILRVVVPLAAVLVGSLAWAAAEGKVAASIRALLAPTSSAPAESPIELQSREPVASPAPPPVAEPVIVPPAAPAPRVAAVASSPRSASPPPTPDDEALYTRAHRLHFVDHDPGAALAAWDAYLRAFPRGRLALESRYNRALCLVRLGRNDEASEALAGFAGGAYGGYRQAEARALLEAIQDGAASGPKPRPPAEAIHDGAASGPKPRPPMEAMGSAPP
jgi:hypothetical protein